MTPVINLVTQAPYFYSNYDFTGFATQGERQFAVRDDGIYELTGDSDDDAPIEAHVTTGLLDFGEPHLKGITAAYVGCQSDASMMMTVQVPQSTQSQDADYLIPATSTTSRLTRLKIGKGVKSRYWQFSVTNTNGAAFELETLDVLPVVLQRRT